MAFGRLDVFTADGLLNSYSLTDPNTSVGRSTGNTIMLDTDSISRYHFTITQQGDQVFITDLESANGTYVDGIRLTTNTPHRLNGGEEIQIGDLRIIYYDLDESPTRPLTVPEDSTQRIELEAPNFRIDLHSPDLSVAPGAHISAEVSITNTSAVSERYLVEVVGLPKGWWRVDRPELEIAPEQSANVVIGFKPLRRSDSAPKEYPVNIVVRRSRRDSEVFLRADLTLHVLPFSGFGMALETRSLTKGQVFRLHLHNQGNAPLLLTISGKPAHDALIVTVNTPNVTLQPGQRMIVQGDVSPRRASLFGDRRQHSFDLVVRSVDHAAFTAATRAYYIEQPPLPGWSLFALLGAASVVVLFIIAGLVTLLSQPPEPVIASFTVSSTRIAQGEPLVLNWQATNAAEWSVSVNGTPFARQSDSSTNYTLSITDLTGEIVVALEAINDGKRASASQIVSIYRPMTIAQFDATPDELVRNVVQPITITWNVPGAVSTRIAGLEGFTTMPIAPAYGAQAQLTNIAGIPGDALTLTLYATDEAGNVIEQALTLTIVDPLCAPASADVTLRAGPSDAHQIIGTVPLGTSVVVDAQDSSATWLRVKLPGGAQGWGARSAFTCGDNFSVENLRKELNIPTPIPRVTPAFTPTTFPVFPTATPAQPIPTRSAAVTRTVSAPRP